MKSKSFPLVSSLSGIEPINSGQTCSIRFKASSSSQPPYAFVANPIINFEQESVAAAAAGGETDRAWQINSEEKEGLLLLLSSGKGLCCCEPCIKSREQGSVTPQPLLPKTAAKAAFLFLLLANFSPYSCHRGGCVLVLDPLPRREQQQGGTEGICLAPKLTTPSLLSTKFTFGHGKLC